MGFKRPRVRISTLGPKQGFFKEKPLFFYAKSSVHNTQFSCVALLWLRFQRLCELPDGLREGRNVLIDVDVCRRGIVAVTDELRDVLGVADGVLRIFLSNIC